MQYLWKWHIWYWRKQKGFHVIIFLSGQLHSTITADTALTSLNMKTIKTTNIIIPKVSYA